MTHCSTMSARDSIRPTTNKSWLVLVACLLSGCATLPRGVDLPPLDDWETRKRVLADTETWAFNGRVGVKTENDGFNARFRWNQDGESFDASLSGPLGIGTVLMEGEGQRVVLTDNDGVKTRLANAEDELYLRYGWTIPVLSLRYWALGIPDPDLPADVRFDENGTAIEIQQSGWRVALERYRDVAGTDMPSRLTATHPTTRVRVIVDDWVFF